MAKGKFGKESPARGKKPREANGIQHDRMLTKHPRWAFARCDKEKWQVSTCENLYGTIIEKLISIEGMTWQEVQSASGGRKHGTNSHFIPVESLGTEAQKRLISLKLDEEDRLFSLRLDGTKRLWGTISDDGVFSVLWYDPRHEVYPLAL